MTTDPIPWKAWAALRAVYTPEGCRVWWEGRNRLLNDERPCDVWERGEKDRVLGLLEALAEGVVF